MYVSFILINYLKTFPCTKMRSLKQAFCKMHHKNVNKEREKKKKMCLFRAWRNENNAYAWEFQRSSKELEEVFSSFFVKHYCPFSIVHINVKSCYSYSTIFVWSFCSLPTKACLAKNCEEQKIWTGSKLTF